MTSSSHKPPSTWHDAVVAHGLLPNAMQDLAVTWVGFLEEFCAVHPQVQALDVLPSGPNHAPMLALRPIVGGWRCDTLPDQDPSLPDPLAALAAAMTAALMRQPPQSRPGLLSQALGSLCPVDPMGPPGYRLHLSALDTLMASVLGPDVAATRTAHRVAAELTRGVSQAHPAAQRKM